MAFSVFMCAKLVGSLLGLILSCVSPVASIEETDEPLSAILELPEDDWLTIDPQKLVQHCSEFLARAAKNKAAVWKTVRTQRFHGYLRLGKFLEARKDIDFLCGQYPKDAELYNKRATLMLSMGQPKEAMQEARKAIELDGKHAPAYYTLAWALAENGLESRGGCTRQVN